MSMAALYCYFLIVFIFEFVLIPKLLNAVDTEWFDID